MLLLHLIQLPLHLVEVLPQIAILGIYDLALAGGQLLQLLLKKLKALRVQQLLLTEELDILRGLHEVLLELLGSDNLTRLEKLQTHHVDFNSRSLLIRDEKLTSSG